MTAKIIILDSFDRSWLAHCRAFGLPTADSLSGALALLVPGDVVLVGSSMRPHIPVLAEAGAVIVLACEMPIDELALRGWRTAGWSDRVSGVVRKVRGDRRGLPPGWFAVGWKARKGYQLTDAAKNNPHREIIYFSPHCQHRHYGLNGNRRVQTEQAPLW